VRYIDNYIREKSIDLFSGIGDRNIVYLDLKYWILIRDHINDQADTIPGRLARKFVELYECKKCIYPVSEAVFWEILKQSDKISVIKTLELVEKLSEGLAIISGRQRVKVEFDCWLRSIAKPSEKIYPEKYVWAKLPLITGYFFYSAKAEELPPALRRSLLDFAANIPLSELVRHHDGQLKPFTGKDNVELMNAYKERYHHENKTRMSMFLSELAGCLDCFTNEFNEVIKEHFFHETERLPSAEEQNLVDKRAWQKAIYSGFKTQKIVDQLPHFKISPSLAGAMRWNKDRKYTDGNDTIDIMHATVALPYCDYFFTERELHTIIAQEKLDKIFNCITASKADAVLEEVHKIDGSA
jgi:hypothetical protein